MARKVLQILKISIKLLTKSSGVIKKVGVKMTRELNHRSFVYFFLIFILAFPAGGYSLNPDIHPSQYVHRQWTDSQGLPQNTVSAITQTGDGILWFGTQEGLVSFDGWRFQIFDKRRVAVLRSHLIQRIRPARGGALWIGTSIGLYKYRDRVLKEIVPQINVISLQQIPDGPVYIGTIEGIYRLNNGHFEKDETFHATHVGDLVLDRKGRLWALSRHGVFVRKNKGWEKVVFPGTDPIVGYLYFDRHGQTWVSTKKGLSCLKGDQSCSLPPAPFKTRVLAMREDRDGNLWVGTQNGLWRLTKKTWMKVPIIDDEIFDIYEDSQGHLWIGTARTGLHELYEGVAVTYGRWEGLSEDSIYTVAAIKPGVFLLSSDRRLIQWNANNGATEVYPFVKRLPAHAVYGMTTDRHGTAWIGTNRGLLQLKNGRFTVWDKRHGLKNKLVSSVLYDPVEKLVWVGSIGYIYRFAKGRFTAIPLPEALRANHVLVLYLDSNRHLWVGTTGGLALWKGGTWELWRRKVGPGAILAIFEDSRHQVWAGTDESGLFRINDQGVVEFTIRDGLPCDSIFSILEDHRHNLWMSCNKGIFFIPIQALNKPYLKKKPLPVTVFSEDDGMRSHECNGGFQPAVWRDENGQFWYPTIRGLVRINPRQIRHEIQVIRPVLVGFRKGRGRWQPLSGPLTEPVVIEPGVHSFEIDLRVPYFGPHPERLQLQLRLKGFEDEWTGEPPGHPVVYQHIRPGAYVFQARIAGPTVDDKRSMVQLPVEIRPFFYQTWTFRIVIGVLILVMAFGVYRTRVRLLERRQRLLERMVAEKTQQLRVAMEELEKARRRFEMLSYEDSLTGLANRRFFDEYYQREWERMARYRRLLTLMVIDIDAFKGFNDRYGHLMGDRCLKRIADVLKSTVRRPGDLVARMGGDEFVIVLPETDLEGARHLAERIRREIEQLEISPENPMNGVRVTVSIGLATTIPGVQSEKPDTLMARADQALYQAKERGRNCVVAADPVKDGK